MKDCTADFAAEYTEKLFMAISVATEVLKITELPSFINGNNC